MSEQPIDKEFNQRAAEIEAKIGRKPTHNEVMRDDLDRLDHRTTRERVFAYGKAVPMAQPDDPLEQKLQEAKAKVQKTEWWDKYRKSGFDQRMVMDVEQMIDDREDSRDSAKMLRDHLQGMESELQPLRELRERMRWNEAYTISDVENLEYAIRVGSTPGHDTASFRRLKADVFVAENARIDKLETEYAAKLMGLTNQLEQIRQSRPSAAATTETTHDARAEALKAKHEREFKSLKKHHAEIDRLLNENRYKEAGELSERGPNYGDDTGEAGA